MVAKTIQVLAGSVLFATSLPVLSDHDWDDDNDRARRYRQRVVVVHQYPSREVLAERPVYVERIIVVGRPVYIERRVVVVYGRPVYEPASTRAASSMTREIVGRNGRTAATAVAPTKQIAQDQWGPTQSAQEFVAATAFQKKAVELVNRLAPEFGVHPRLALAVIRAESNFNPTAHSHKNAQGLMQLRPATSARFNVSKPFDPVENVRGGLAYLRWLLAYFQGNVPLVAAAYNAGEGAVNRHRGVPPFAETQAYVKRITEFFGHTEHPYDSTVTTPSPELNRIRSARG